jgi:signal transduction histidine kinase
VKWRLLTLLVERELDVVTARQRARVIAERLGFSLQDQTRIATAVSEIARNAFSYAGGGKVEYGIDDRADGQAFVVRFTDRGPGIADLSAILDGQFRSPTGLGLGIVGARRLVDEFHMQSAPGKGTTVTLARRLPNDGDPVTGPKVAALADAVRRTRLEDPNEAIREQNRDLLRSLAELAEREDEAQRLNRELAETNRGVVALYADLEAQAVQLRDAGANLERLVAARTAELAEANDRLRAEATERERMEADLRQSQKMEAVGQLTGGIAHDFNNLLTGIVGSLDLMRSRLASGQMQHVSRYMDAAMQSANRAAALTHRLLAFARRQPLDPKSTDANVLLSGMSDLLRRTISESIELRIATADDLWLTLCDPHQLENAILNLAINARDAMPDGGVLTIDTCNRPNDKGGASDQPGADYLCVRVTDTGTGMPPDVIARAFDPFFTTKPLGQGTGLGLSMIYGFARQSKGHARIESEVGKGTSVSLLLPRYDGGQPDPGVAAPQVTALGAGAGETVLVVEDEAVVRDMIIEVLEEQGYRTLQAHDGFSGLDVLNSSAQIDLLITDVGLPGLNGRQLADQARTTRPDLPVLLMTGYAENLASAAGILAHGMTMITKPFTVDAIVQRVRTLLD